jgi:hypothetical protein
MKLRKAMAVMAAACVCIPAVIFANPTSTTTFGSLPGATFGGIGNPNNAVEVTTITTGSDTLTLGLAAQQRFENSVLGNNGNGTYFATPGANYGNPANPGSTAGVSTILGSTWDFDYYVNIAGGGNLSDYKFVLSYALTPGTALGQLGTVNVNGIAPYLGFSSTGTIVQDSENLDFAFLGTSTPGLISPPAGSFNPNAGGDYLFTLDAYDSSGDLIGQSDINVDVSAVPDSSWSIGLLGIGVLSLYSFRRFFEFRKQMV